MKQDSAPERNAFQRIVDIRSSEMAAVGWSWLYVFTLFLAYYVLRPIREDLGVSGGVKNLPWLFTGSLIAMLLVNPLFAYAVGKWTRGKIIATIYRFCMLNLVLFLMAFIYATPEQHVWIGRVFFIWVSVFNLFVVSVYWSFIVDIFDSEQGKRLFGFLAAGATLGGIAGSALTSGFIEQVGMKWLFVAAIVLLEISVYASQRLAKVSDVFRRQIKEGDSGQVIGGSVLSGITHTFKSPYLLGIAFFMLFYSMTSTFVYFQQASIAETTFKDSGSRTVFFANIDFWVNIFTLLVQVFLTGRLMKWFGVMLMLCALPLLSVFSFGILAMYPVMGLFVAIQVVRRVSNFALALPAREVLFTSVPREDRYKAKNFIDTVVYRTGDQAGGWVYTGFTYLGLGIPGVSVIALVISTLWLGVTYWLGQRQEDQVSNLS